MSGIGFPGESNFAYTAVATAVGVVASGGVSGVGVILSSGLVAALDLNFAGTAALPSTVTFSRGTNATFTNSIGGIQSTVGINSPRFDYNPITLVCKGLLIEEARTNLALFSQVFTDTYWQKNSVTITPDAAIAPSKSNDAMLITDTSAAGVEHYFDAPTTVVTNQTYTQSIYVKAATAPSFTFTVVAVGSTSPTSSIQFNQTAGVYTPASQTIGLITSATATAAGSGWFRCTVSYTLNGVVTLHNLRIYPYNAGLYAGTSIGHYFWGAQIEAGSYATSYIPTAAAATTRNADVAVMTGTNFSSWYNQTQGTIVVAATVPFLDPVSSAVHNTLAISDNTLLNRQVTFVQFLSTGSYTVNVLGTASAGMNQTNAVSAGVQWKSASAYAVADFASSWGGLTPQTFNTPPGPLPTVNTMYIGVGATGTAGYLNGCVASISYYPTRSPNATLQLLSDYTPPATLDLNFAETAALPSTVTFSRGTNATVVDSTGAVAWAPNNLLTYSEQFNNAVWTGTGVVTPNTAIAPDGSLTADKVAETATTDVFTVVLNPSATFSTQYTYSCYAKAGERNFMLLNFTVSGPIGTWNLTTGQNNIVGGVATSSYVGNGWWRCSVTFTTPASGSNILYGIFGPSSSSSSGVYTGTTGYGIYIWGAQLNVGALQPYNQTTSAAYYGPRFDYDPITLACKGLLIEEARTNSIRNNTMQGAVVGTPGAPPTNTSIIAGGGVSSQIVSIGVESGVNYYDVRFFGTASSVVAQRVYLEIPAVVAALTGQSWTFSAYLKLISGTTPVNLFIGIDETGPGATYIRTDQANLSVTNTLTRYTYSTAISGGASVAFILPQIGFNPTINNTYDFTLRIGLPQLELGAFATSVIPTTTAAATRNADVALMTGTNFSSWYNQTQGTLFGQFQYYGELISPVKASNQISIDDGTVSNIIWMRTVADPTSPQADIVVFSGGVSQVDTAGAPPTIANTVYKRAFAFSANNTQAYVNAVADGGTNTSAAMPVGVNRLVMASGAPQAMWISRITYYPARLSNATLQVLTI